MDQEMVQARIGGAIVPAQIIDSICSRQLQVLLADLDAANRLSDGEAKALEAWAVPLARQRLAPRLLERLEFDGLVCWDSMQVTHLVNTKRTKADILAEVLREFGAISQLRKPGVTDPTSVDSSGASDATEESNRASILAGLELGGYLFLGSTVQIFGMRYTTAGRAAFIVQLTTVLVPLLDAFLSRRMPNRNALGGCALAFLGVSVLLTDGGGDSLAFDLSAGPAAALAALLSSPTGIGDGLVGISALAYSLHVVRLSYHAPRLDPILLARAKEVARLAFATLVLAVGVSVSASQGDALLAFAASFRDAPSDAALAMSIVVWNGLVTTAFPTWAQSYGQRAVSAGTAQVMYTSQPLWSSLFGFLVLGETFSQQGAMGAFLVFSAVLLVATAESATPIESTEEASSVD